MNDGVKKVIFLPLFYDDLYKITNYIAYKLENKKAAVNLINKVEKEIKIRASTSAKYEKYNSTKIRNKTYYRIYVNNYTIFYTLDDNIMEVRRILYSRRNLDNFL